MEENHAVKHVRHRPCPEGKGFHAGFIIGAGMAEGNGNFRGDFFEQRQNPRHLRCQGKVPQASLRRLSVAGKESLISLS